MVRTTEKVVCYVVHDGHLLVFTHDNVPMEVTGVQVPAGTIREGESADDAALRELAEETGLEGEIVSALGAADYDVRPMREEICRRHFYLLSVRSVDVGERWTAGEDDPADGGSPQSWTCFWIPLAQGHVLSAGLGALLHKIPIA